MRIARTEAEGLGNVSLCFFGAADENFTLPDKGMRAGKISIELQRMLAFGDALRSALGPHFDHSQQHMAARKVRDRRQGLGQLRLGRREGGLGIGH